MAIMINCAVDWTFDEFVADMESVKALPMRRGVYSAKNLTERQKFCQRIKTEAKYFAQDNSDNGTYLKYSYDYVGDAFARELEGWFSDWYKDVYNQRPHFDYAYVAMLCDLPVFYEHGFCDGGKRRRMQEHIDMAKRCREEMDNWAY